MTLRKVYAIRSGDLRNLRISESRLEAPSPGEVQIQVSHIGLNFADLFAIWGLYSATPKGTFIPGLEYSGTVSKVGDNALSNLRVGDKIMGITRFGAYATALNIDARYVVGLPDHWELEHGAAYLVQVLTAYYALFELGNLAKDKTVLIHSGAGGVGIYANRLAKGIGAHTIGTTGSKSKEAFMKDEGYDRVIVRSSQFAHDLKAQLGERKLDLILECIGGTILKEGFNQLAPEGRMVVYGSAQYASAGNRPNYLKILWNYLRRPKIDPLILPNTNRSILGFNLIWLYHEVEKMHDLLGKIEQFKLGLPHIGHRFAFDELPQAVKKFQSGTTTGKLVVAVQ